VTFRVDSKGKATRSGKILNENPGRSKILVLRSTAGISFVEATEGGDVNLVTVYDKTGPRGFLATLSQHEASVMETQAPGYCQVG
jgi:hypothetical protein